MKSLWLISLLALCGGCGPAQSQPATRLDQAAQRVQLNSSHRPITDYANSPHDLAIVVRLGPLRKSGLLPAPNSQIASSARPLLELAARLDEIAWVLYDAATDSSRLVTLGRLSISGEAIAWSRQQGLKTVDVDDRDIVVASGDVTVLVERGKKLRSAADLSSKSIARNPAQIAELDLLVTAAIRADLAPWLGDSADRVSRVSCSAALPDLRDGIGLAVDCRILARDAEGADKLMGALLNLRSRLLARGDLNRLGLIRYVTPLNMSAFDEVVRIHYRLSGAEFAALKEQLVLIDRAAKEAALRRQGS